MNVDGLTRYGDLGASSRVRWTLYQRPLARVEPSLRLGRQSLLDDTYLRRKYGGASVVFDTLRGFLRRARWLAARKAPDARWIEKELWPFAPAWLERAVLRHRPYVVDLDDAIFHNYDLHPRHLIRRLYGRKIDKLMAGAALVTAGNDYLAQRARAAGARRVEILPTVIDLDQYPVSPIARPRRGPEAPVTIGWIGSPATQHYLQLLAGPLARLAQERPIRLLVIGGRDVHLPGVEVVIQPWSAQDEVASICRIDVGVMPLASSPWEQGKCGYKLIQYMACGVPVVGSPVGVNRTIVTEGVDGFLAEDAEAWYQALARLAADADLRARMGDAGRRRVEQHYCVQRTAPMLAGWLRELDGQRKA
jgi:glycosyltransferase involved in cell wall biosynthesis